MRRPDIIFITHVGPRIRLAESGGLNIHVFISIA